MKNKNTLKKAAYLLAIWTVSAMALTACKSTSEEPGKPEHPTSEHPTQSEHPTPPEQK